VKAKLLNIQLPTDNDVTQIVYSFARLQTTYSINSDEFIYGKFAQSNTPFRPLNSNDNSIFV
jgi:hypothetical protein